MEKIKVAHPSGVVNAEIKLTASKSECNRALIIQALSENNIELSNISEARDCQTMIRLLKSEEKTLDVLDAGTTMRFLTAFCTITNRPTILTGTPRMQERPIKILVDALRSLGAEIDYLKKEGYPPHEIKSFEQKTDHVKIQGNVSSQYISAMLMVAPTLPQGLKLELIGEVASVPYIKMTLQLLSHFGITHTWDENVISIAKQPYQSNNYSIESDWSGASYWYSIAALSKEANIKLLGLRENSLQGDKAIVEIMEKLGVKSTFDETGVLLTKIPKEDSFEFDFTHCPDLAQTVAVICAATKTPARMKGLESLRIKETDRIAAIETELKKVGHQVEVIGDSEIIISAAETVMNHPVIDTYDDHRMAMAFAPLGLLGEVTIEEPSVVNKSYPVYWDHLKVAGFELV
ncbi:3-phosphoshikimate 1-carboxyvinyltransferase [Flexithrix dorotheae]|uniref:3-phosphoshikimate 1-carboxyvinyltransferase n=1 Tax=Flexithrix dorotheae TaxID=70993 RepID=UPI000362DA2B|nr:3-phosphoshikimate 1-carboxyvinyltransferase [Flexithrix dorotheae]